MRTLTPEVVDAIGWFQLTHEVEVGDGGAMWRRRSLPAAGGLDEQDTVLLQSLGVIEAVANTLLWERRKKGDPDREREAFHDRVRAERT